MPGREIFLRLADLAALQVADLGGETLDRRGDDGERREIHGMTVARDDLGRDRLGAQSQRPGHVLLDPRIDIGEGPHRSGERRGGDLLTGRMEPPAGAGEFRVGVGELDAKRGRFGMDAVAAADGDRVAVLEGTPVQGRQQRIDIGHQ